MSISVSIAMGCSADGSAPPATGELTVATATTGFGRPAEYTITVPNVANQSIGANASATFTGLSPGPHLVTLSDIPLNCTTASQNPRSATVRAGDTTAVSFSLSCDSTGNLQVSTLTNGSWSPAAYRLKVDGGTEQDIAPNTSIVFYKVSAGDHQVRLDGIPATCGGGPLLRTATIVFQNTTSIPFSLTCSRTTAEQGAAAGWTDPDAVSNGENSIVLTSGGFTQVGDAAALWNDVGDPTPGANLAQPDKSYAVALILTIDASSSIPGQDLPSVDASVRIDWSTDGGTTWTQGITLSRSYSGYGTMSYSLATSVTPSVTTVPAQLRMRLVLSGRAFGFNGGRTAGARIGVFRTAWLQDNYPITW